MRITKISVMYNFDFRTRDESYSPKKYKKVVN
jgi:hypothetical protein